ncbi:MAG: hypothetical protein IPM16_07030 [Chloroflexi bacterium]|nr:hypothetical protein [Chloroflexota bacterium]
MLKLSVLLLVIGGIVLAMLLALPLLAPGNALSSALLTPLLCGGDTYVSDAVEGTNLSRAPTLSLRAYCVPTTGPRREVTSEQVNIALIAGGVPLVIGLVLFFVRRSLRLMAQYATVGRGSAADRDRNPTN